MTRLQAILSRIHVPVNRPIFDERKPSKYVFIVTDGVVTLFCLLADGPRRIPGFLYAGDFLGLVRPDAIEYA